MYTERNFKTKKALKIAVDAYNMHLAMIEAGAEMKPELRYPEGVRYFQPGPFGGNEPKDGTFCVEGPHYPEAHRWYANCTAKDGVIIKVR